MSRKAIWATWAGITFAGVAALSPVVGCVAARVEAHGKAHERLEVNVPDIQGDVAENKKLLMEIRDTVSRIEGRMEHAQ